jgi:hypothetical protein
LITLRISVGRFVRLVHASYMAAPVAALLTREAMPAAAMAPKASSSSPGRLIKNHARASARAFRPSRAIFRSHILNSDEYRTRTQSVSTRLL